jgi:hypothetical protein
MQGVSIRPSDFVEGGLKTVDHDLTWKNPHFALFDYTNKEGVKVGETTVAMLVTYITEDGSEQEQAYSAGDPARFQPSKDGKRLEPVVEGTNLSKSSNYFILMSALINAGFPENKLSDDVSILDGLVAHHIGLPVKERAGLNQPAADPNKRPKVLSVPSAIIKLPWEKKAGKGAGKASGTDATAQTVAFIGELVEAEGSVTRQEAAQAVFKKLAKDPNRDAVAAAIYSSGIQAALVAAGFTVKGEEISK